MLLNEAGHAGDRAVDLLGGGAVSGGDAAQPFGGTREHLSQERTVQPLLAAEVVVEHRLVDPGAAGDAIDAGAGEPACAELERGGGEDGVRGDAGGARHRN